LYGRTHYSRDYVDKSAVLKVSLCLDKISIYKIIR